MLGKFNVDYLLTEDSTFGPILYCLYNIFIVFILLTMLISIINESFKVVRMNTKNKEYDYHLINFVRSKIMFKTKYELIHPTCSNKKIYKDHVEYLNDKIEELLSALNNVSFS
jgi:hypothetical protein